MVGSSIGPYRILEKLGAGGMGDVYLAEDARLRRKVALKSLSESLLKTKDARQRLLREARAAAGLNHPNIAAIHDIVETEDRAHIVMEYVQGETLAARLAKGRMPGEDVVPIAIQLCDAVIEAHAHGVIHRDLKPGNVLLTPEGKVKVLDFGLAKTCVAAADDSSSASDPARTDFSRVVGTPAYMSPEQIRGLVVDGRTDLYSLGVLLFELLTGRRPFEGEDAVALGMAILTDPTPTPTRVEASVPAGLSAIVARAMARERDERFQSALEMREALRRLPTGISDRPTVSRLRTWVASDAVWPAPMRSRLTRLLLALVLAAPLPVIGFRFLRERRLGAPPPSPDARPALAVLPLSNVGADPSDEYLGVGIADTLIARLAALPSVTVVSRASFEYRGRQTRKIARDLGVDYVVTGGVQRSDRRLRVTLSLVRPDDSVAWGGDFEATLDELFPLQSRIAEGLSTALQLTLTAADRQRLARSPTASVEAFADYSRGRALLERPDVKGNLERATQFFEAAIRNDPRFALAHAGLGEACWARYQETKDAAWTKRALDSTTEALRLDPEQPAVRVALALIYQGTGRPEGAIEELRKALAIQPNGDDAHRLLGHVLSELGKTEDALLEFRQAIALRPDYWRNHSFLGYAFFKTGRYAEAVAAYRRVTELQPDNAWGFQMLGTAYQAAGDGHRALENYKRAIALGRDASAYSNLGTLYYAQGDFAEAARAFEEAVRLDPASPAKHRNLGDAYDRLGDTTRARAAYLRAVGLGQSLLRVNPRDARTLAMLAVYEAKLGRRADAARHTAEATRLSPEDGDVLYRAAIVHTLAGRSGPALMVLREAVKHGYSRALAREDDDLGALRGKPEFQALVARRE